MDTSTATKTDDVAKPTVKAPLSALQAKLSRSVQAFSNTLVSPAKKSTRSTSPSNRVRQSVSRLTRHQANDSQRLNDRLRIETTPARRFSHAVHQSNSFTSNMLPKNRPADAAPGNSPVPAIDLYHPAPPRQTLTQRIVSQLRQQSRNLPPTGPRAPQSLKGRIRDIHIAHKPIPTGKSGFNAAPKAGEPRQRPIPDTGALKPRMPPDRGRRMHMTLQLSSPRNPKDSLIDGPQQQQHETISFPKRLQDAVSNVAAADSQTAGRTANAAHHVASWGDSSNAEADHRSHQENRTNVEVAEISNPEASEPSIQQQAAPHPLGMPLANQLVGWDKVTHGIADARTNNRPKQPLRRIR